MPSRISVIQINNLNRWRQWVGQPHSSFSVIILGRAIGANLSPMAHDNMTYGPKWPVKILDGAKFYPDCAKIKQEGQVGPGSLTWFFEIALANFFFFVASREEFTRISLCLYSARSLHSLIPCLLTDQNFKNNSENGHSRKISMRLFQNVTNSFREDFLWFCLCSYSQVAPIHQSLVHGQIKISLTFLRQVTFETFLWIGN